MAKRSTTRVVGANYRRWRDEATGLRWDFSVTWAEVDGRFEPVSLTIRSASFGVDETGLGMVGGEVHPLHPAGLVRGLSADEVRRLPLGTILADLRASHAAHMRGNAEKHRTDSAEYEALAERWTGTRVPLAEVARVYSEAVPSGSPRQAVMDRFDKPLSTVNRWIRQCREVGLLGPTTQGKAGGGR